MTTITLPPDLEIVLAERAGRSGTTAEQLAIEVLRQRFPTPPQPEGEEGGTLYDFLKGFIGTVEGTGEDVSDGGRLFADHLVEQQRKQRAGL